MSVISGEKKGERDAALLVRAAPLSTSCLENLLIHGTSAAIQMLREHIETAASLSCAVLVYGRTGDGATVIADAIHRQSSSRNRPLVHLDCSIRFPSEAEAVLFGAKGLTGVLGIPRATVVIKNVDHLSFGLQARLAKTLQTQTQGIDRAARVIATSAEDLAKSSREGTFNRRLVVQLNSFSIRVPQLTERRDDIPGMAQIIIDSCKGSNVSGISSQAASVLKNYPWKSIDQLKYCVEFATRRAPGPKLDTDDLPAEVVDRVASATDPGVPPGAPMAQSSVSHDAGVLTLSELERLAIIEALRNTHGNKVKAAAILGIGKTTLYRKVQQFGLG